VWGLLYTAAAAAVAYLIAYRTARKRDEVWRQAARAAGVTHLVSSSSFGIRRRLTGRCGPLSVSFEPYRTSRPGDVGTRLVIDGLGHPSGEFALRREALGLAMRKALGGREIEIGERAFDDVAYVQGAPHVVRAILDAETRRLLGPLLEGRVEAGERRIWVGFGHSYPDEALEPLNARISVFDGTLRADIREPASTLGDRLTGALGTMLDAARRLILPDDIPARLAENARHDPVPAVRLANLLTLAREYPDRPGTKEALREACRASLDDEMRLRAAVELGEEGWDVLLAIASSEEVEDSRAARATAALGEHLPRERAETILRQSLQGKRRACARAAIRALGRIGGADVLPPLAAALAEEDEELVAAAATALGESGEAGAEEALIGALHRESRDLRVAIAEAVGRVGSAAAVAPLRDLASQHPLDPGLRRASRQAIAEIQSRLTGATPGQLALAEGESGQLSLADKDAHGSLSLASEASIGRADESPVEEGQPSSSAPEPPPPRRRERE